MSVPSNSTLISCRYSVCIQSPQKTRLLYWLQRHHNNDVQIKDVTSSYCRIMILGPFAKRMLQEVCSESIDQTVVKNSRKVSKMNVNPLRLFNITDINGKLYFLQLPRLVHICVHMWPRNSNKLCVFQYQINMVTKVLLYIQSKC